MIIDLERTCFSITHVGREVRFSCYNKRSDRIDIKCTRKFILSADGELKQTEKNERDSIRRARKAVVDYALCNDFDYFGTITLSNELCGEEVNNPILMQQKLSQALEDYKRYYAPKLQYLFTAELGKKTNRLHFHFLIKGIDNTHLFRNEYGYLDWSYFRTRFGHVQITAIKNTNNDRCAVAKYCSKYISKDSVRLGNMRYFCSKTLNKPIKEVCEDSVVAFLIKEWLETNGYFSYIHRESLRQYVDCFAFPLRVYKDLQEFLITCHFYDCTHLRYGDGGYEKLYTTRELKDIYQNSRCLPGEVIPYNPFDNPEKFSKPNIIPQQRTIYTQCSF